MCKQLYSSSKLLSIQRHTERVSENNPTFQLILMPAIAEANLKAAEKSPQFSILLLNILRDESLPLSTRQSGAVCFKNFMKYNYVDEERNYLLPENEVVTIKQELIGLMISQPPSIQSQLGEAISLIADSDFWDRWDTLVDDLVSRLGTDAKVNNGVLEVAHSIFRRWRPLFRSDELFTEINHVLGRFATPFLQLLESTDAQIDANSTNAAVLRQHFTTLNLMMQLFFDLSCQDLPPMFEENLSKIATLFDKYLKYDNPILVTDDDAENGPMENVKTGICEVMVLWVQKYEDAFGPLLQPFITTVWNMLTTVGPETKYDLLVSKSLQFLTAVTGIKAHAENFNNQAVLEQVVEKAIIPSVSLRESDVELFEDEPIEYIRKNLEGTDVDTRRRAATEFLRTLLRQFETLVTQVVGKYVTHYLGQYSQDSSQWKSKDAAVYLFSAIAAQGTVTAAQGVLTTNQLVNVVDFFRDNIASDLAGDTSVEPILKVDAINYLYTFRSQLTKEQWGAAFSPLVQNLGSNNYVVYTYASIAVERVLALTDGSGKHIFGGDEVKPFAKDLLAHLFTLIEKDNAPEKIQENEFLMRCVMRILIVIRDAVIPIADMVLEHLIAITDSISTNPSNPRFYYYHFEAIGALIKYVAPVKPEKLEQDLFRPFAFVLQQDIEEFKPYVFQLFGALLEAHPSGALSDYYKALIAPVLQGDLWLARGNVPALTRLLASLIPRGTEEIIKNDQLTPILGIFQRLVSKKSKQDIYGFDILESVITSFTGPQLAQYFPTILSIIYARLGEDGCSEAFKSRAVRFYHLVSSLTDPARGYGTDYFLVASDASTEGAFVPLYLKIILPTTTTLVKPLDRKLAAISLTKNLTDSQAFAEKYKKGWGYTAETLTALLANAITIAPTDDVIQEADVDDLSFGVGFTQLNTCKKTARDEWNEVTDVKAWVANYFMAHDQNGRLSTFAKERLSPEALQNFGAFMKA